MPRDILRSERARWGILCVAAISVSVLLATHVRLSHLQKASLHGHSAKLATAFHLGGLAHVAAPAPPCPDCPAPACPAPPPPCPAPAPPCPVAPPPTTPPPLPAAADAGDEVLLRLRALFEPLPRQKDLQPGALVFLTFSNGHYTELMLNSVATLAALRLPVFVYCLDEVVEATCIRYGIPHFPAPENATMQASDFRQDRLKFRAMGARKPEIVLRLFKESSVKTVVLTDTDTIWLRDPTRLLARHPRADIFATTDCLSFEADIYQEPGQIRCGHASLVHDHQHWGINTGVTVYRDSAAVRTFLADWREAMVNASAVPEVSSVEDDQTLFNYVLVGANPTYRRGLPLRRDPDDSRAFYAGPRDDFKAVIIPSALIPGGRVEFDYHLAEKYGTVPYAIHATYQRYNNPGKRLRFREAGAWLLEPPEYYAEGRFMTVRNNVHAFLRSVAAAAAPDALQPLHKQLLAAAYQHAVLRDAYAIARALNRTLVLPPLYAWCDWDPMPSVLHSCISLSAEGHLPYQAPSDVYVNIEALDGHKYISYRERNFLEQPQVPGLVKWDKETVYVQWPGAAQPRRYGTGMDVTMGFSDESLRGALQPLEATRVLAFENLQPHSFAGFANQQDNAAFERFHVHMRWEQKWCCMTMNWEQKRLAHQHVFYLQPTPLTERPRLPWPVPAYELPEPCKPDHENALTADADPDFNVFDLPNHPCQFLRTPPRLPVNWTAAVSQLRMPVLEGEHIEAWAPFKTDEALRASAPGAVQAPGRRL